MRASSKTAGRRAFAGVFALIEASNLYKAARTSASGPLKSLSKGPLKSVANGTSILSEAVHVVHPGPSSSEDVPGTGLLRVRVR